MSFLISGLKNNISVFSVLMASRYLRRISLIDSERPISYYTKMMINKKIISLVLLCLLVASIGVWYKKKSETYNSERLLSETYKLEAKCATTEPIEFPIQPFDDAIADTACIKNLVEFADLKGIDLNKIDPEQNCKCLGLNLDQVLEKYKTVQDQCLLIQAKNFVEKRCKELAVK